MTLSVVIPTKNEAANIAACIRAFDGVRDRVEVIVVDNASTDGTPALAAKLGARVFEQGPERCAQRNRGGREATGDVLLFVDADMTLPAATTQLSPSFVPRRMTQFAPIQTLLPISTGAVLYFIAATPPSAR